ncbi:hypothetical protein IW262DRAFT_1449788 [Armillaria fumosa]|nr:hypothetical protein IW262DRAFT_1449788 [Armillaria fumosa]
MSTSNIFRPITVGRLSLSHRVVPAPMGRFRVDPVILAPLLLLVRDYYTQRAKVPGMLLITEGTMVPPKAAGVPALPEIWTEKQISAWTEVVLSAQSGYIYMQIAAFGRQASPEYLKSRDSTFPHMTKEEINEYIEFFGIAATNAVHKAGFDGFLQTASNIRDDEYGGSTQKRVKFSLEVIERVVKEVGADRVRLRLRMRTEDPIPIFSYLTTRVKELYPDFAYIHVIVARVDGASDLYPKDIKAFETNDFIRKIWALKPLISAGGYTSESGMQTANEKGGLIAYGRWYLSNPDLVTRLEKNIPFTKYDRSTFYIPGEASGVGYTDYPFAH